MKDKNKVVVLVSGVLVILLMVFGISFAIFRFGDVSANQELVLGDIWMKYTESNGISLENALPGDEYTNYFEFHVTGTNTYTKKDIYYDISLTHGDVPAGKEENNRVEDKYLKFKLTEINGDIETEIFTDKTYADLTNKRVHVSTISKSTNEYSKTYRLYMVISEELTYGNSSDAILTTEEFGKIFGSIKVNVTGDFNEKELAIEATDESCFNAKKVISSYVLNTSDDVISICATYLEEQGIVIDGTYEDYCISETEDNSLKEDLDEYIFSNSNSRNFDISDLKYFIDNSIMTNVEYEAVVVGYDVTCGLDVVIPSTIGGYKVSKLDGATYYDKEYDALTSNDVVNIFQTEYDTGYGIEYYNYYGSFINVKINSVIIPETVRYVGEYEFAYNNLTNIEIPSGVINIDNNAFRFNDLTNVNLSTNLSKIGDYAFYGNDLINIEIPNSVTDIGISAFSYNSLTEVKLSNSLSKIKESTFSGNDLTSIKIPNSVTYIGIGAFSYNSLTSVEIPDSVQAIDVGAFSNNDLKNVKIGSGIQYIEQYAFNKNDTSNPNLESITFISKTCEEIKNIRAAWNNSIKPFPWLYVNSPYYLDGYKADVIGTDGVCSY